MHPDKGSFQEKGLVWLTVRGCDPSWGKAMLCSAPLFLFMQFRTRVQGMAVHPFMLDLPVSRYLKKLILHRHAMSMQKHVYIPLKIPGVSSLLLSWTDPVDTASFIRGLTERLHSQRSADPQGPWSRCSICGLSFLIWMFSGHCALDGVTFRGQRLALGLGPQEETLSPVSVCTEAQLVINKAQLL